MVNTDSVNHGTGLGSNAMIYLQPTLTHNFGWTHEGHHVCGLFRRKENRKQTPISDSDFQHCRISKSRIVRMDVRISSRRLTVHSRSRRFNDLTRHHISFSFSFIFPARKQCKLRKESSVFFTNSLPGHNACKTSSGSHDVLFGSCQ